METIDQFQGKKNVYVCQGCGHAICTVDRDQGVTPFMVKCRGGCGTGSMYSEFYRVPQNINATWEWYRATDDEVRAMPAGCWDHHRQGGLFLREREIGPAVKQEPLDLTQLTNISLAQKKYLSQFEEQKKPEYPGNRSERRRAAKLDR